MTKHLAYLFMVICAFTFDKNVFGDKIQPCFNGKQTGFERNNTCVAGP